MHSIPLKRPSVRSLVVLLPLCLYVSVTTADEPDPSLLTIERIYGNKEFDAESYSARWLPDESAFTTLEPSTEHESRHDIVRHDAATGEVTVIVSADELIPPGDSTPLKIDDYAWSKDLARLLIYTNSQRVWREKTRGDYWLLDRAARRLTQLGRDGPPASMMFAELSPTGEHVAFVRDRNIYVEDLYDHTIRRLTTADTDDVINGTTDWCYEEEFRVRDGFCWSPDGERIAYWQVNTEGVGRFPLVNHTDSLYPEVSWFAYPKVGQRNPACRIGVVELESGDTTWMDVPGDPREHYIPRMQWANGSDWLLIQQLNRLQNRNQLYLADAVQGGVTHVLTEKDDAWVDVHDELFWLTDGARFTWISERDGWRHAYLVSRGGDELRLMTPGDYDVVRLLHVDDEQELIYFIASPDNATERFLYRARFDGTGVERVTPADETGVHDYRFSDDGRWAVHSHSRADRPGQTDLVSLPDHQCVRLLDGNEELIERVELLDRSPTEFFRVDIGDEVQLDAWCIRPPDFDPARSYPLLIYVYGEPAGSTVTNRWGGGNYLWHQMLAQQGYVVMSFDNRGAKVPRGRDWRKCVYGRIGSLGPADQAAAVRAVLEQRPYLNPDRVGIWGWSGGGSSSLHAIFKYPHLYSTAIAIAPVPNQCYYDTMYQERYMGLPSSNVDGYREGSAINFAGRLEGNLLLVHGTGDDNCHYQTTELLIDELIAHGRQFSLMVYPNRTHAVKERRNTTPHLREMMTRFLLDNLPVQR